MRGRSTDRLARTQSLSAQRQRGTGRPCSSRSLSQGHRLSGGTDFLGEQAGRAPTLEGKRQCLPSRPPASLTLAWLCPQGSYCSATFPTPKGRGRGMWQSSTQTPQRGGQAGRAGQGRVSSAPSLSPGRVPQATLGQCLPSCSAHRALFTCTDCGDMLLGTRQRAAHPGHLQPMAQPLALGTTPSTARHKAPTPSAALTSVRAG